MSPNEPQVPQPEQSNSLRPLTTAEIAEAAIDSYVEYLDYGYEPERAKASAIFEVLDGERATEEVNEDARPIEDYNYARGEGRR